MPILKHLLLSNITASLMKILYEDTMPHAADYFSQLGDVKAYSWQALTPKDLVDVDVLAVRSTTKITPELLSQAKKLKTIATATAGINHMNVDYLQGEGIDWYAAGGCNADAVAQYVVSAIMYAHSIEALDYQKITVGIVGAGNVGTALSCYLDGLDIEHVLCDPPLEHQSWVKQDTRQYVALEHALSCDVVSLHVPYVKHGEYATDTLLDKRKLATLSSKQWLINACRGEVIDEDALLALKQSAKGPRLVLDVWNNEPNINAALLPYVDIATPHIAGHTDEGKIRGTQMVFNYLRDKYHGCSTKSADITSADTNEIKDIPLSYFLPNTHPLHIVSPLDSATISRFLQKVYDIHFDHRIFVENMAKSPAFSKLRKNYQGRREYTAFDLIIDELPTDLNPVKPDTQYLGHQQLAKLGFKVG